MKDKEKVVVRLEGKELKTFTIEVSNRMRIEIEAFDEQEAREELDKLIEDDYDYPYNNAVDYDGWEVEDIKEVM